MTRRPKSRRPPKLPDGSAEARPEPDRLPRRELTPRELLKKHRVSGCPHPHLGRQEVRSIARRIAFGDPRYAHRLDLGTLDVNDVYAALRAHWGCTLEDPRARLGVDLTIARIERAAARIDEVATSGGRVIFATSRPASLLGLHLELARRARARGAAVLSEREATAVRALGRGDRRIWWIEGVAVLTDGSCTLAHDEAGVWPEVDFAVGRAELVVTDGALAAGALEARFEVVALADLEHAVLGVAAERGSTITIVPAVCSRPPWCYQPLLTLASQETRSTAPVK